MNSNLHQTLRRQEADDDGYPMSKRRSFYGLKTNLEALELCVFCVRAFGYFGFSPFSCPAFRVSVAMNFEAIRIRA